MESIVALILGVWLVGTAAWLTVFSHLWEYTPKENRWSPGLTRLMKRAKAIGHVPPVRYGVSVNCKINSPTLHQLNWVPWRTRVKPCSCPSCLRDAMRRPFRGIISMERGDQ